MEENDILANLHDHVFYHGTSLDVVEKIVQEEFRVWWWLQDEYHTGWTCSSGNLGRGIYLSCNWRVTLWFGPVVLRVTLEPDTRLLDASQPPDRKVLAYLEREFGRDIFRRPPWKVLPKNKRLTLPELIALFCYHYWEGWEKPRLTPTGSKRWLPKWDFHISLQHNFRSQLIRYGFHGFGNPADDNGIVVFSGDRIRLLELVGAIPMDEGGGYREDNAPQSLEAFRADLRAQCHTRASALAQRIAAANVDDQRR